METTVVGSKGITVVDANGRKYEVNVISSSMGKYKFTITDDSGAVSSTMTSCGHPVNDPQGHGIPSAALIAIECGTKPYQIPWATHYRNKLKIY